MGLAQGLEGRTKFTSPETAGSAVFEIGFGIVGNDGERVLQVSDGKFPFAAFGGEFAKME